jgi:hypothetical protein
MYKLMNKPHRLAAALAGSVMAASPSYADNIASIDQDSEWNKNLRLVSAATLNSTNEWLTQVIDFSQRKKGHDPSEFYALLPQQDIPGSCLVDVRQWTPTLSEDNYEGQYDTFYTAPSAVYSLDISNVKGVTVSGPDVNAELSDGKNSFTMRLPIYADAELLDILQVDDVAQLRLKVAQSLQKMARTCNKES